MARTVPVDERPSPFEALHWPAEEDSVGDAYSAAFEALETLAEKLRSEHSRGSSVLKRLDEAAEVVSFALNAIRLGPIVDPERRLAAMARTVRKPARKMSVTQKRVRIVVVASLVLRFRELGLAPDQLAPHVRAMLEGPIASQFGSIDAPKMARILESFVAKPKLRADGRKAGGATNLSAAQRLAAELVLAARAPGFGADRNAVIKAFEKITLPKSPK